MGRPWTSFWQIGFQIIVALIQTDIFPVYRMFYGSKIFLTQSACTEHIYYIQICIYVYVLSRHEFLELIEIMCILTVAKVKCLKS